MSTDEALNTTIKYVQNYKELKDNTEESMELIEQKCKVTEEALEKKIIETV